MGSMAVNDRITAISWALALTALAVVWVLSKRAAKPRST